VTVHDGSDPSSSHVIIGRTTFDRVTLERGFTADNTFATWARAMQYSGGPPPRKNVRIELRDAWQRITAGWDLSGALPVKYAAPDLDPCGNAVAIEEITLDYDGLKRDDDPRE
jgi:phage tail-like protein